MNVLPIAAVALAMILSGPAMGQARAPRFSPAARQWRGELHFVETDDVPRDCGALFGAARLGEFLNARACARVLPENGKPVCYIVTSPIRSERDFNTDGHELRHCLPNTDAGLILTIDGVRVRAFGQNDFHDGAGRWHLGADRQIRPGPAPRIVESAQ